MTGEQLLSIGEVVRRTGLSERALRFYEKRGLLRPRRTAAGRRVYGAAELVRLHEIAVLKRAGFTLAQIGELLSAGRLDAEGVIRTQIDALEAERKAIGLALAALNAALRSLEKSGTLDAPALLQLIQLGERKMQDDAWRKIHERYHTPEDLEHWKQAGERMPEGFNQEAYTEQWRDLSRRIEAALPLDPASDRAQAFLAEWNRLLEPFMAVADERMKQGAAKLWERMDEWQGEVDSPVSAAVWSFIREAQKRQGCGG